MDMDSEDRSVEDKFVEIAEQVEMTHRFDLEIQTKKEHEK
jgi:hypothetical protein